MAPSLAKRPLRHDLRPPRTLVTHLRRLRLPPPGVEALDSRFFVGAAPRKTRPSLRLRDVPPSDSLSVSIIKTLHGTLATAVAGRFSAYKRTTASQITGPRPFLTMPRYNPATIEPKWQNFWEKNQTFACPRLPKGRKFYVLDMFPYPSGDGLHVGHPEGYTATDIVCRYRRMRGTSVHAPDGLGRLRPARRAVRQADGHAPAGNDREQHRQLSPSVEDAGVLLRLGPGAGHHRRRLFSLDAMDLPGALRHLVRSGRSSEAGRLPSCRFPTKIAAAGETAVDRYRDEHRLAYQLEAPVNWCPALGTVLANEEVTGGVSERGGHPVVRIQLRQWMLRITAYADRLEKDLDGLDWPESIKLLQRNWIGRSTGAEVDFFIGIVAEKDSTVTVRWRGRAGGVGSFDGIIAEKSGMPSQREYQGWLADRKYGGWPRKPDEQVLRIYTTRPDTLFGATYMVIAPEHPFVERLSTPEQADAVRVLPKGRVEERSNTFIAGWVRVLLHRQTQRATVIAVEVHPIFHAGHAQVSHDPLHGLHNSSLLQPGGSASPSFHAA